MLAWNQSVQKKSFEKLCNGSESCILQQIEFFMNIAIF